MLRFAASSPANPTAVAGIGKAAQTHSPSSFFPQARATHDWLVTFILPPTCFCFYYLTSQLRYSSSPIKAVSFTTPSQDSPPSSSPSSSTEVCQSGISIIAEPGSSIRDDDAVACCDKYGVSLLFTNVRHFRH